MGHSSRFDVDDWSSAASTTTRSTAAASGKLFARSLADSINPSKMKNMVREARDSAINPKSTPVIICLDLTGSMGSIPRRMFETDLGKLFAEIYTRKPISDPQVLFCGVGDVVVGDKAPFQVGQFESGHEELTAGLETFWLDGCHGGGNNFESYDLPYWFAANHTASDAFQKRGQKGIIFTIGDENPPTLIRKQDIKTVFGYEPQADMYFRDLLTKVKQQWIPYHIVVEHSGSVATEYRNWKDLLGQNAIHLTDYTKISEVIVSILELESGKSKADVVGSWKGDTALVVSSAIRDITVNRDSGDLVAF